jgi:hypothetical protein
MEWTPILYIVEPIARGGTLRLSSLDGLSYEKMIRLAQLQLEQVLY